jgi:DNA-binding MarR family transcriptional regulator
MATTDRVPLSSLLSRALVAFTVEFDNEAEHRLPHRTTNHGVSLGAPYSPWLVSMAMWFNCMRFVAEDGIAVRELERRARTPTNLAGMERWGYVRVAPDPADRRPKPPKSAWLVRATPGGKLAYAVWEPLVAEIAQRWEERFGAATMETLRVSLASIAAQLDPALPNCLPILGYGLTNADRLTKLEASSPAPQDLSIPVLLAKVLLAFALDFERRSMVSLAIFANLLCILDERGVRVRDLPERTGVSKESLHMAIGILVKKRLAVLEAASKSGKILRLTPAGVAAAAGHQRLLHELEGRWTARFGPERIGEVRGVLEELNGDGTPNGSPLFRGLEPYPDGWRAAVPRPSMLPHFPMVLHRGGFPDGS